MYDKNVVLGVAMSALNHDCVFAELDLRRDIDQIVPVDLQSVR